MAVLALGLSTALVACGSEETDDAGASASPGASAAASTPAASAPASAAATPSASATPKAKPTTIKDLSALTVTPTTPGKAPKVTGKWPLAIDKTQVKVLTQGKGPAVPKGGTVEVNYQGVNARTGKVFDESFSRGQTASFPLDQVVTGFKKGLEGQKVGSRVLVMMTGADGYDASGGQPAAGIEKGDNLIFTIDVISTPYTKPTGKTVAPKAGLPTVKDDAKGVPTVTIPKTAAPTSLVSQPLVEGEGKKIKDSDAVTVKYRAYTWADGKLMQDNYATGAETAALSQLIPAWKKGLVGKTTGSRVLVVAPPADAYGEKGWDKIPGNATMVYVIDVLDAQDASQMVQ